MSVTAIGLLERGARRSSYRGTVELLADALELSELERTELEAAAARARARGGGKPSLDAGTVRHNIPEPLTSFVGRDAEVADLRTLLAKHRMITITGPGGTGKTRLALEIGRRRIGDGDGEVWFVDLAPIGDDSFVAARIAAVTGAISRDDGDPDALGAALKARRMLLILDNCEHVISGAAAAALAILQRCPQVDILATSRERIAISGEAIFRLRSLPLPERSPVTLEQARSFAAFELFIQRSESIDEHQFTAERIAAVTDICHRLDGLPLAIELAVARLPMLGLTLLRARLKERFILTGGGRDLPARQQTMIATIAWSYNLLSAGERALLRRLAIFAGGTTLDAAEAVCADDVIPREHIADLLSSLVEKSLLNPARTAESTRYALLESVRTFALEQLDAAEETPSFARRHAHWLADLADRADANYLQKPMNAVLVELWPDLDNVRAALEWALQSPAEGDGVLAGRIAGGLRGLWILPGRFAECRRWIEPALARIDGARHPHVVARLLRALIQSSDGEAMFAAAARALDLFESIGDRRGLASLHNYLAFKFCRRGRPQEAQEAIDRAQSLMLEQQLEESLPFAYFLNVRALVHAAFRRFDEARADLAESACLASLFGDEYFVTMRCSLFAAEVEFAAGNIDRAGDIALEIIESQTALAADGDVALEARTALASIRLTLGDLAGAAALAREMLDRGGANRPAPLEVIAAVAARRDDAVTAAHLAGFVDAWCASHDHYRTRFEQSTHDILNAALREHHSGGVIAASRAVGSRLSWERAIDLGLRVDVPAQRSSIDAAREPTHDL
jgi:predicted ATPase